MILHKKVIDLQDYVDYQYDEDVKDLPHRRHVKKMLEKRLEIKRLRHEIDEWDYDCDLDWDDVKK